MKTFTFIVILFVLMISAGFLQISNLENDEWKLAIEKLLN